MARFCIFGNELVKGDDVAVKMIDGLREKFPQHEFIHASVEELPLQNKVLNIIDAVKGINKVEVFTEKDLHALKDAPNISMHDFDLALNLKIMINAGIIERVRIIGVPFNRSAQECIDDVCRIISVFSWED